jgi:hypothetical protein
MRVLDLMTMLQKVDPTAEITIEHSGEDTLLLTEVTTTQTVSELGIATAVSLVLEVEPVEP